MHTFFDMADETVYNTRQFVRWTQPPQAAYFINSMDRFGNHNVSTVTMGTAMIQGDGFYYPFAINYYDYAPKDSLGNLCEITDCVISYVPKSMLQESWIAAMPVPKGIDEAEICNFHLLPSKKVKTAGIYECPINLECEIVQTIDTKKCTKIYIAKVVGVTVHSDLVEQNNNAELATGVLQIDPLFEVVIDRVKDAPPRLYYATLNREQLLPTSDELGSIHRWGGGFKEWIHSELERGRISQKERDNLFKMAELWLDDPHPVRNSEIKRRLTKLLQEIVWRKKSDWASCK